MGLKPGDREYNADTNKWEVKKVRPVAKPASVKAKQQGQKASAKSNPKVGAAVPVSKSSTAPMGKGAQSAQSMARNATAPRPLPRDARPGKKKPIEITVKGGNKTIGPMGKGALSGKSMSDALTKKK